MLILAGTDQDIRIFTDRRLLKIRDRNRTRSGTLCRPHGINCILRLAGIRNTDGHILIRQASGGDLLQIAVGKMPAWKSQIQKLSQQIHCHDLRIFHTVDVDQPGILECLDHSFVCLSRKVFKSFLQHTLRCHRNIDRKLIQSVLFIKSISVHKLGLSGIFRPISRFGKLGDQLVAEILIAVVSQSPEHPQHRGLTDLRGLGNTVERHLRDLFHMIQYVICGMLLRFSQIRVAGFDQCRDIVLHGLFNILQITGP